jgi:signal peptidase
MKNKFFKTIYYLLLTFALSVGVLLVFSIFPVTGNYKLLVVKSGSMEPEVKTGSVIVIKPKKDYRVGDIITFGKISRTDVPITHRIVEITNENSEMSYVTKGDANKSVDNVVVKHSEVKGGLLFSVPYLGYVIDMAKTKAGMMVILIIPAFVIVVDEIRKIVVEVKKIKKEKRMNIDNKYEV